MSSQKLSWAPTALVAVGFAISIAVALGRFTWPVAVFAAGVLVAALANFGRYGWETSQEYRTELNRRASAEQEAAARAKRQQAAGQRKKRLITELGTLNFGRLDSANAAVKKVIASEAAREGWLGDVDFTADIAGITEGFRKAQELREVVLRLAKLDNSSAEDRKILADARRAAAELEKTAIARVELIQKCAIEAERVDHTIRQEREDARTAEQRGELHAKLSSLLYGIEVEARTHSANSAADSVMARVRAYKEVNNQIQLAQGN